MMPSNPAPRHPGLPTPQQQRHSVLVKLRWTNIVAALTALAVPSAIAPHCAGWHWTLDLLACFPVQSLQVLATGAAILAIGRKWWLAGTFAAFALLATSAIAPGWRAQNNFPGHVEKSPEARILSLNLLHSNIEGQGKVLGVVRELAPDLIWLTEYTPLWQKFLTRELPDYPYRCEQATHGSFGAALFSRHPLALAEMIELGHSWAPACRAVVQMPFGAIGLLGVHPPPPGLSFRRSEERNRGLAAIPLALENLPERRVVCGDFNATPWNAPFQELRETTGLSAGSTTTWLPSWPAGLPSFLRVPIDHVLVAGKVTVGEVRLGPHVGSDHLPLFAVIRVIE
ncbi:MAG: endonuclease/exonuclease/phosphatase (EEP) superfamily protein YafD [Planctomycetota bacterium]|jgi:endonuclease/exonuclease/phosphatase (EEP) superfamily protein YafD